MRAGPTTTPITLALAAMLAVSGCGNPDEVPELMNIRAQGNGPDEFAILPPKALQLPESLSALPEPTPGGRNLTDPTPNEDAIIALGGQPGGAGIPAGDSALVAYAGRDGIASDIRGVLAAEDLAFRQENDGRLLERVFNISIYYDAYADQSLDQQTELARWRARGVPTPSAPPPLEGEDQ
jgi:hypothetical protein